MSKETTEQIIKRLKDENPLSPKIEKHYKLEGIIPGVISWNGTHHDMRTIDKKTADRLVEEGYPNLVAIPKTGTLKS